jgi:hypothetical protein
MKEKNTKMLYLLLFVLIFPSCNGIKIPNTEVCSTAGSLSAGMDCAETMTSKKRYMTLDETLKFLGDGALCQSSSDWVKNKTTLEQACMLLGPRCSREFRALLNGIK